MARETRSTAKTATKALALEQMPILGIRDLRVEITRYGGETKPPPAISAIRVGIELFNAGRVPVKYQVMSFAVSLGDIHTYRLGISAAGESFRAHRVCLGVHNWIFILQSWGFPPMVRLLSHTNTQMS